MKKKFKVTACLLVAAATAATAGLIACGKKASDNNTVTDGNNTTQAQTTQTTTQTAVQTAVQTTAQTEASTTAYEDPYVSDSSIFDVVTRDNFVSAQIRLFSDETMNFNHDITISNYDETQKLWDIFDKQKYRLCRTTGFGIGTFTVSVCYTQEDGSQKSFQVTEESVIKLIDPEAESSVPGEGGLIYNVLYDEMSQEEVIQEVEDYCLEHEVAEPETEPETVPETEPETEVETEAETEQEDYFAGTIFDKITPENFLRVEISLYDDVHPLAYKKCTIANYSEIKDLAELLKTQKYVYSRIQGADEVDFGIHIYFINDAGEEDHVTVTEELVLRLADPDPSIIPDTDGALVYHVEYPVISEEECVRRLTEICSDY